MGAEVQQRRDLPRADNYRLCGSDLPWVWFTDLADYDDLISDKLAEPPRVGTPYHSEQYDLLRLAVDGPFVDENTDKTSDEINRKGLAWIESAPTQEKRVSIPAKTTLDEFVELVEEYDGFVFVPADYVDISEIKP